MTLHSLRGRLVAVAPLRIGLGLVWLAGARVSGAGSASALLAFATGALLLVILAVNDPRSRFFAPGEAASVPPDAFVARPVRQALRAAVPSTVGVSLLAALVVVPYPVLASFLGGVSAGLGVAGLLAAARTDPSLLVDPRTGRVYRS